MSSGLSHYSNALFMWRDQVYKLGFLLLHIGLGFLAGLEGTSQIWAQHYIATKGDRHPGTLLVNYKSHENYKIIEMDYLKM